MTDHLEQRNRLEARLSGRPKRVINPDDIGAPHAIEDDIWRETQNGWAARFADGLSATILVTRKGSVRWNMALTEECSTVEEARKRIEFFHRILTEDAE